MRVSNTLFYKSFTVNNEAHVLRRRVPIVMLGGELDFLCLVLDDVGDLGVGVVVVGPAAAA